MRVNGSSADGYHSTLKEPSCASNSAAERRTALVWVPPANQKRQVTWLGERTRWKLGRDAQCDVVLSGGLVSRAHAEVNGQPGIWFVSDLSSSNGTYVNGRLVRHNRLSSGDVLRIGDWVGLVLEFAPNEEPEYGEVWEGVFGGPDLFRLRPQVETAGRGDFSVVVTGATGTGKELLARAIHRQSGAQGPFVAINCALYSGATAVAELFGYRKGAFTGAERAHPGTLRSAEGGSVLLDEVADLDLGVQAQLLRVLENRELPALGEARALPFNARFIAAAQEPLEKAVARGTFRADLRARLEGLVIHLPELRLRRGDVPFLFQHLFRTLDPNLERQLEAKAIEQLCLYAWPLNVRELVTMVRRLIAAHPRGGLLTRELLLQSCPELETRTATEASAPASVRDERASGSPPLSRRTARAFELRDIEALTQSLQRHSGNVTKAAQELGITRTRAYRLLEAKRKFASLAGKVGDAEADEEEPR